MAEINHCYLSEIYSAIQGEGPLVGLRQIFIRFCICDLRCSWCDTPRSLSRTDFCNVETNSAKRTFTKKNNPLSMFDVIKFIKRLKPELHHSISLTGGEPLLQSGFLHDFLPRLKKEIQLPLYLETAGHRPEKLKEVIKYLDYISMDFKLPSSTKLKELWKKHAEFLKIIIKNKKQADVKIVTTEDTSISELIYSAKIVKSLSKKNNNIQIIIQPVTKMNGILPPGEKDLLAIHSKLLDIYPLVRVIPQVHVLMGQH